MLFLRQTQPALTHVYAQAFILLWPIHGTLRQACGCPQKTAAKNICSEQDDYASGFAW
jgi:hypothetical protein